MQLPARQEASPSERKKVGGPRSSGEAPARDSARPPVALAVPEFAALALAQQSGAWSCLPSALRDSVPRGASKC